MKKYIFIFLLAMVLLLCSCSNANVDVAGTVLVSNSRYKITEEDDVYYLYLLEKGEKTERFPGNDFYFDPTILEFDSIAELKTDIKNNKLTKDEISAIWSWFWPDYFDKIQIIDIEHFTDPILPHGYQQTKVTWINAKYNIYYENAAGSKCMVGTYFFPKAGFSDSLGSKWAFPTKNEPNFSYKTTYDAERNAIIYYDPVSISYYEMPIIEYTPTKWIQYCLSDEKKTIFVLEEYRHGGSKSVPSNVSLWINDNGNEAYFYITDLEERPSVEWLSQFGIKKYEG